jgi:hypothetical protein
MLWIRRFPEILFKIWQRAPGGVIKDLREKPAHQKESRGIPFAAFTQQSWLFLNALEGHLDMEDD